uniref:Uncharacterized protein n=1 Tax=Pavo cristatus TaxID=9049 RepID=A0A8C9FC76_PAVCR
MLPRATARSHWLAGGMAEPADYPPFQLGKPRFEQTSFYGRFRHFLDIIDPRTLFVTEVMSCWLPRGKIPTCFHGRKKKSTGE